MRTLVRGACCKESIAWNPYSPIDVSTLSQQYCQSFTCTKQLAYLLQSLQQNVHSLSNKLVIVLQAARHSSVCQQFDCHSGLPPLSQEHLPEGPLPNLLLNLKVLPSNLNRRCKAFSLIYSSMHSPVCGHCLLWQHLLLTWHCRWRYICMAYCA